MRPKPTPKRKQFSMVYPDLLDQLDPKSPLLQLAHKIPWEVFEREFTPLYAGVGRPAKRIRLMVGLLILKQVENLSDERVVAAWVQNPYYQAFCGEEHFRWTFPCAPSELVHFRKRIGESGAELILKVSAGVHGEKALESEVVVDTTVQEKNIAFPTDIRLQFRVIEHCLRLAESEAIELRRSYRRELRNLKRTLRFSRGAKNQQRVNAARRRLKTIANILLREITRKLSPERRIALQNKLQMYTKIINQERNDKDKIYSVHEPEVQCIAKGKAHKKYEFGSKVGVAVTKNSSIIVGACNFSKNIYDGNTLEKIIGQISKIRGFAPSTVFCDRGFRGRKKVGETTVAIPETPVKRTSEYAKRKARKNFGRRSAIEPVIGHMKNDFRMARNYLKGTTGDAFNVLLVAAAFNFRKWMNLTAAGLYYVLFLCFAPFLAAATEQLGLYRPFPRNSGLRQSI